MMFDYATFNYSTGVFDDYQTHPQNDEEWKELSGNPGAIHLIEQNLDKADWRWLSCNPAAMHIIYKEFNKGKKSKIDWEWLSTNPAAIDLLKANRDRIDWSKLSRNPEAMDLLNDNQDKINWKELCRNTHPNAIALISQNLDKKIDWDQLSRNHSAIHLLKSNMDKIAWDSFCHNTSPLAIEILLDNFDKINWHSLSLNPAAMHILDANIDFVSTIGIWGNPAATSFLSTMHRLPSKNVVYQQNKWNPHHHAHLLEDKSFQRNYEFINQVRYTHPTNINITDEECKAFLIRSKAYMDIIINFEQDQKDLNRQYGYNCTVDMENQLRKENMGGYKAYISRKAFRNRIVHSQLFETLDKIIAKENNGWFSDIVISSSTYTHKQYIEMVGCFIAIITMQEYEQTWRLISTYYKTIDTKRINKQMRDKRYLFIGGNAIGSEYFGALRKMRNTFAHPKYRCMPPVDIEQHLGNMTDICQFVRSAIIAQHRLRCAYDI